jgi:hypothetical protein
MLESAKTLAQTYAGMTDEDIQRLALDSQSLTSTARGVLRKELERRRMGGAPFEERMKASNAPMPQTQAKAWPFRTKLVLFVLGYLLYLVISVYTFPTKELAPFITPDRFITFELTGALFFMTILKDTLPGLSLSKDLKLASVAIVLMPLVLLIYLAAVSDF